MNERRYTVEIVSIMQKLTYALFLVAAFGGLTQSTPRKINCAQGLAALEGAANSMSSNLAISFAVFQFPK